MCIFCLLQLKKKILAIEATLRVLFWSSILTFFATSISGINGTNSDLPSQLYQSAVNFDGKMAENTVFYSEVKAIIETVIKTAVDVIGNSKQNSTKEPYVRREVS